MQISENIDHGGVDFFLHQVDARAPSDFPSFGQVKVSVQIHRGIDEVLLGGYSTFLQANR
jgi:hypothetical protein